MNTDGGDVVPEGLETNELLLGWDVPGLGDCHDYDEFRDRVHAAHYKSEDNYRRSGRAASQLWKFFFEMQPGT